MTSGGAALPFRHVVVSGASGHLGGWIVALAVAAGARVTAIGGPDDDVEAVRAALVAGGVDGGRLTVRRADLAADVAWDDILSGGDAFVHVAAPIPVTLPEASSSLVVEAREGARRVMAAAARAGIGRVVATSSIMAAVYDSSRPAGHVVDEADWSAVGREPMTGYAIAKTEAERASWQAAGELGLSLTVINPGMLLGPGFTPTVSASLHLFQEVLAGHATIAPRVLLPLADVRDVAALHIEALCVPRSGGERVFAVAEQVWLADVIRRVRALDGGLAGLPEPRPIADHLARRLAEDFSILRYLRYDIGDGRPIARDRAAALFGTSWRPLDETLRDTVDYLRALPKR